MMEPYLSYPSLDLAWSRAYQIHKMENNPNPSILVTELCDVIHDHTTLFVTVYCFGNMLPVMITFEV